MDRDLRRALLPWLKTGLGKSVHLEDLARHWNRRVTSLYPDGNCTSLQFLGVYTAHISVMATDLREKLSLQARSLESLILQMNDQYEAALAANAVPSRPRWMDYCQQQWDARGH